MVGSAGAIVCLWTCVHAYYHRSTPTLLFLITRCSLPASPTPTLRSFHAPTPTQQQQLHIPHPCLCLLQAFLQRYCLPSDPTTRQLTPQPHTSQGRQQPRPRQCQQVTSKAESATRQPCSRNSWHARQAAVLDDAHTALPGVQPKQHTGHQGRIGCDTSRQAAAPTGAAAYGDAAEAGHEQHVGQHVRGWGDCS